MRNLLLSALLLASAFQTALGQTTVGAWTYIVENGGATITASTATGAVTMPSELGGYAVKKLGNGFFPPIFGYGNTSVTTVVIPNSVTSIGNGAFQNCTGLTSITIPNSVTSIGGNTFSGCNSLASVTIPNSVTSIGGNTFIGCTSLTSITISSSVTSIGSNAFQNCIGLTSVIIPNSVTSIGASAFAGCTGLTSILLPSTTTIVGANAIPASTAVLYANQLSALAMDPTFGTALASNSAFVTALANNPAFVFALVNSIKATSDNYGFATQSGLSSAIEPLATKTQITTAINEGRASGIASVTASPNTWSLFTTSQIQNMAVGDLVLTRQEGGGFVLNYDIEQSTDLQTWTPYQALSLPLSGLPADKAFVRIKAKQ
jgi:hypothetical protein